MPRSIPKSRPKVVLLVALVALVVASDLAEAKPATCPASVSDSSSCNDICQQTVEKNKKMVPRYPCRTGKVVPTEYFPAAVFRKTGGVTTCKCCCDPNDIKGIKCLQSGSPGLLYPYECDVNSKPDPKPGPKPESPAPGGTVQSKTCQQMGVTTPSDCKQKCHFDGNTIFNSFNGKITCKCGDGSELCTDGGGGGGGGAMVVMVLVVVAACAFGLFYAYWYWRKQQAQNPNVYDPMQDKHADVGFSSA